MRQIVFEAACMNINISEWERLMKGARKASYNNIKRLVKKCYPDLYLDLALDLYNPYQEQAAQTNTHYILVSSAIEYFFLKSK